MRKESLVYKANKGVAEILAVLDCLDDQVMSGQLVTQVRLVPRARKAGQE